MLFKNLYEMCVLIRKKMPRDTMESSSAACTAAALWTSASQKLFTSYGAVQTKPARAQCYLNSSLFHRLIKSLKHLCASVLLQFKKRKEKKKNCAVHVNVCVHTCAYICTNPSQLPSLCQIPSNKKHFCFLSCIEGLEALELRRHKTQKEIVKS